MKIHPIKIKEALWQKVVNIILIQIKETLERAAELGGLPEESEYPFPELIILMGRLKKNDVYNA